MALNPFCDKCYSSYHEFNHHQIIVNLNRDILYLLSLSVIMEGIGLGTKSIVVLRFSL